jgi:hypothetical protein
MPEDKRIIRLFAEAHREALLGLSVAMRHGKARQAPSFRSLPTRAFARGHHRRQYKKTSRRVARAAKIAGGEARQCRK